MSEIKLSQKGKTVTKPDVLPDNIVAFMTRQSAVLELSSVEIENLLSAQLAVHPMVVTDEDNITQGGRSALSDEEDEWNLEEFYDSPDMEENIETGEGETDTSFFSEPSEDFWQYAWRRWEEEFDPDDDKEVKKDIRKILEYLESTNFSTSFPSEDLLQKYKNYRLWFDDLQSNYPGGDSDFPEAPTKHADIIINWDGSNLDYEIDLGFLDRIIINNSVATDQQIFIGNYEIYPAQLPLLVEARRAGLILLAEYLIKTQVAFFKAHDFNTALERLRSDYQKNLADYFLACVDSDQKERKPKQKEDWASRIIKNKWVKAPFHNDLIPVKLFFDEKIGVLNVLKKALELRVFQDSKKWIAAPAQVMILRALDIRDIKERQVRNYNNKYLKIMHPEALTGIKKISDSELTDLINRIGKALDIIDSEFEVEDIIKLRINSS